MEEGDPFTTKSPVGNLSSDAANAMDLDFIDELFLDGCWIETTDSFDFDLLLQPGTSLSPAAPIDSVGHEEIKGKLKGPADNGDGNGSNDPQAQGTEGGKRLWIPPNLSTSPGSSSLPSVKERLMTAVGYLQECTKGSDVLIQIWIPVKRGGKNVLTTDDQPFTLDPYSKPLESYRNVSRKYQFPADEDSKESVGLPGRVFLAKVPEWTPDVRFFRSEEYPRIDYARQCDVRGSVAVPVFERGSGTCLGVVELVTTSQKINYRPDLEIVCKALEAVDLRSSQSFSPPGVKAGNELYQSALPRILEVLKSVSKIYGLPLALTWASCVLQGKEGCRHSDENYSLCVSTVDPACFVADAGMHGFLEACSEHHLLRGQGVVGKAFSASKPCFSTDITAFGKTEYPLSHHARMFELHCAIAIPLVSIYTNSTDFVLELFLPKDCKEPENRDQVLNSLAGVIHQAFHNSQFVTTKEIGVSLDEILQKEETKVLSSPMREQDREHPSKESSWITNMVENQRKGKGVSVSVEYPKQPREEFRLTTHWDAAAPQSLYQGFWQVQENSEPKSNGEGGNVSNSFGGTNSLGSKKTRERKRTKAEKTISLEVLRQYFAGSLKDAARSIGVCPTTLKRICRQHGINRWPSRKIKKVGHSLKKLQGVIDSVQGAEGSIQLESFYASFPELSPGVPGSNGPATSARTPQNDPQKKTSKSNLGPEENGFVSSSQSPSSSCSQSSTSIANASSSGGTAMEDMGEVIKRAHSEAELMKSTQENISPKPNPLLRSQSHKLFGKTIAPIETLPPKVGGLRVKASYGEEKIRFSLQTSWGFRELQQEIAKRFGIDDFVGKIDLKYLDDDNEWVLLTCDADLEECIDVCRASSANRIQISLHHQASKLNLNSYGSSGAQSQHHERFL